MSAIDFLHQRGIDDFRDRTIQRDPALMEDDDARRNLAHEIEVVFDDQNAQPVDPCEGGQEFCETLALGAREPRRRLVEQHDLRFERQHHRKLQCLLQPVAQEAGLLMQTFRKAGGFQHGACGRRQRQRVRREEQRRALVPCTRDPQAIGHTQGLEHRSRLEFAAESEGDDAMRG